MMTLGGGAVSYERGTPVTQASMNSAGIGDKFATLTVLFATLTVLFATVTVLVRDLDCISSP